MKSISYVCVACIWCEKGTWFMQNCLNSIQIHVIFKMTVSNVVVIFVVILCVRQIKCFAFENHKNPFFYLSKNHWKTLKFASNSEIYKTIKRMDGPNSCRHLYNLRQKILFSLFTHKKIQTKKKNKQIIVICCQTDVNFQNEKHTPEQARAYVCMFVLYTLQRVNKPYIPYGSIYAPSRNQNMSKKYKTIGYMLM